GAHAPGCGTGLLGLWLELVTDAVARLDERMPRRPAIDLVAQASDEDIDRTVPMRLPSPPELLLQFVARDDAATVERELIEQLELRRRQLAAHAVDIRLHLARIDRQLLDVDALATLRRRCADAPSGGCLD